MRQTLRRFHDWWFAKSSCYELGIFRILIVCWHLWYYQQRLFPRLRGVATRSVEFFEAPSFAGWLSLPLPLDWPTLSLCMSLAFGVGVFALLGLVTRASLVVFAGLNLVLGSVANGWGYSAHASALPALVLLLVAFAPGATSYSCDRLIAAWFSHKKARGSSEAAHRPGPRAFSVWPIRAMLVTMSLFYFSAGYSKLKYSGLAWADGQTLAFYLGGGSVRGSGQVQRFFSERSLSESRFRDQVGIVDYAYVGRPTALSLWLSRQIGLVQLLSWFSLLWELLFPLALLGPRVRAVFLLTGAAFHLGIALTLRINFTSYLVCYAAFINWSKWGKHATVGLGLLGKRLFSQAARGRG